MYLPHGREETLGQGGGNAGEEGLQLAGAPGVQEEGVEWEAAQGTDPNQRHKDPSPGRTCRGRAAGELVGGEVGGGSTVPWDWGQGCSRVGFLGQERPREHGLSSAGREGWRAQAQTVNEEQVQLENPWQGSNWGVTKAGEGCCFAILAGAWDLNQA